MYLEGPKGVDWVGLQERATANEWKWYILDFFIFELVEVTVRR